MSNLLKNEQMHVANHKIRRKKNEKGYIKPKGHRRDKKTRNINIEIATKRLRQGNKKTEIR